MDSYLTLSEALQKSSIPVIQLHQLIQVGRIKTAKLHGEILLRESDVMANQPEDMYRDLENKPISIGDASRKYGIPQPTISRWKDKGLIRVLFTEGQKVMLDEAGMARMAAYYQSRPGRGRRTDIDLKK